MNIRFNVDFLGAEEEDKTTRLSWRIYILTKHVVLSPEEVSYCYEYKWQFDYLVFTDAFGKEHKITPPAEIKIR